MNILIVTPFFKQDKNIASVRWTNIAQRLSKNHRVFVVSQPVDDMDMSFSISEEDGITVARCNQKTSYEKFAVRFLGGKTGDDWQTTSQATDIKSPEGSHDSFVRKLKNALFYKSMQSKAKSFAREIYKKVIPKGVKIDVVISSACPFIEILFGYELKRRLDCKWVCDFRDLPFFYDDCDDTHRMKKLMQKTLLVSDAITVVVDGMKDFLADGIVENKDKIHIVTNGFSLADAKTPTTIDDDILHIVHTGSLYGGRIKSDLLFKAIKEVHRTHPEYKFLVECAGGNNTPIIETAEKYGLKDIVIDYGFVPRDEALKLQNRCDCLLLLLKNRPGGMLSGKVFEYLLCNKPIICTTCGDIPDCYATFFVQSLGVGLAIEEVNGQSDVLRLADYLSMQLERKISDQKLLYNPDTEKIKRYDHDYIGRYVEKICLEIIK